MLFTISHKRIAWEDRFNRPTVGKLRAALDTESTALFDRFRGRVMALDGVTEDVAWHGECWRWTVEYHSDHSDDPLAVVVPSPADLQLAVPLERAFARALPTRRMKRALRDGLELAQDPFDTRWGVWSIQAEGLLHDVVDLIERKLRHLTRQTK